MTTADAIELGRHAIFVAMMVCAPALLLSLVVGLVVSLLQAVTQIQEPTLTFIPKMAVISIALLFFGPFMLAMLTDFMASVFNNLQHFTR